MNPCFIGLAQASEIENGDVDYSNGNQSENGNDENHDDDENFESPEYAVASSTTDAALKSTEEVPDIDRHKEVLAALYIV